MSYRVICGRQHDPDLPCNDGGAQALRGAGIAGHHHISAFEFRRLARLADRWILKVLLALVALIVALTILTVILEKKAF